MSKPADPKLIEMLNEVLTAELTSINQYFIHAKLLASWGYPGLSKEKYDESIVEMRDEIGADIPLTIRSAVIENLKEAGVQMEVSARAVGFSEEGVAIERGGDNTRTRVNVALTLLFQGPLSFAIFMLGVGLKALSHFIFEFISFAHGGVVALPRRASRDTDS